LLVVLPSQLQREKIFKLDKMSGQTAVADLPAMKTNPKVLELYIRIVGSYINILQYIFFTDFDGTITLQDSKSTHYSIITT
jgi:hypothetical protein